MAAFACMVRPISVPVTLPKAGESKFGFGLFQRTKLNGFCASILKSKVRRSWILKARPMVRASCLFQNPRTQLRFGARLPKLNPVEVVDAAEFRKRSRAGSKSRGSVTRYGEAPDTALPR